MLNSESSSDLDQQRNEPTTTEQVKMAATEAGSPRRLGLNLNLSVQPHVAAYHWPHSTVADDTSPSRSKGTDDDDDDRDIDDDDMDCRQDEECSPEDEQDILEMQREERETLNQLARQLASGSRLITPMLQHLVYQHPGLSVQPSPLQHQQQQSSGVAVSLTSAHRQPTAADLSPKSSHSGDTPMSGSHSLAEVHSPSMSRNNEAQSWTFEEQFRQLYSAGSEADRRTFLDSLFSFMQEQGTPISRLPIMAKRVLDLYTLYKLVVQRGGIVAVITKKLWQEIIRGLGLPPSITSAAFTLRTQYVKYLYAYESRMNQFSTLDELNMAIAGNRREGRRNKSLMYSDMPPPLAGHPHHHHHGVHGNPHSMVPGAGGTGASQPPPPPPPPPPSHHHHHYVLAAEDRFRQMAAAIIDNHHHAAAAAAAAAAAGVGVDHSRLRQSCSPPVQQQQQHPQQHQQQQQQQQQQPPESAKTLQQTPRSSPAAGLPPPPAAVPPPPPPSSLFNGHQPSPYQHVQQQQQQQQHTNVMQTTQEQTNKQRELLSMLMWMDIVRANQNTMPRLPIPSLPSSPSAAAAAAAAYTAAAALNLSPVYKGPMANAVAATDVPEQSEALNLGKKRTSNNNDSEDERGDEAAADGVAADVSAVKRIKTEPRSTPPRGYSSGDEAKASDADSPPPTASDVVRYALGARRASPIVDEDVVEMDINTSPTAGASNNNGLAICVTRRTKTGVYRGQLTKTNALVNGGLNNNANPFVLHLNGDLYTGHLQLQQQQQTASN